MLAFLGIAILVIVTPGPDTALTINNALRGGRAGGILTALGVAVGQLIWALATSVGLVAVLLASEPLFYAVKLAGAAYLVVLGVRSLLAALRSNGPVPTRRDAGGVERLRPTVAVRQGIVNNLGNPKMAAFFASVLPQFAPQVNPIALAMCVGEVPIIFWLLIWGAKKPRAAA